MSVLCSRDSRGMHAKGAGDLLKIVGLVIML